MPVSKSRLFAFGLLTAGLGAAVMLGNALPSGTPSAVGRIAPAENAPQHVAGKADSQEEAAQPESGVRVKAPSTEVNVDKERGKVRVKAPYTDVRVDPDTGRVQVRAPYVDLDIRW